MVSPGLLAQALMRFSWFNWTSDQIKRKVTLLTLQQRQLLQCLGKLQAQINFLNTDLLEAKGEDDMPGNTIFGKRGQCYIDLQTQ